MISEYGCLRKELNSIYVSFVVRYDGVSLFFVDKNLKSSICITVTHRT